MATGLSPEPPFASEVASLVPALRRGAVGSVVGSAGSVAGFGAALFAPPLASYTAVLLADTATPSWHDAYRELPFVFVSSALAASAGAAMIGTPTAQTGPARRLAVLGAAVELIAERRMESTMGLSAEPLHHGKAGRLMKASKVLMAAGAVGAALGGRSRSVAALSGAALLAGSLCTRLGVFEAGQESAKDPKYTVVPQRRRLDRGEPVRYQAP